MTTATAILGRRPGPIVRPRSTAQSEPASTLAAIREKIRDHLLDSYAVSGAIENALAELDSVCAGTTQEGWNGYGARRLSADAAYYARLFLQALPPSAPVPEVSADPDGEIALDWQFAPGMALSVSIGAAGRCSFAWMRGRRTYSGTEWVDDDIPTPIADALWQLASESRTSSPAE
jgi:hypothetical protein